jgi:hypothetical protein
MKMAEDCQEGIAYNIQDLAYTNISKNIRFEFVNDLFQWRPIPTIL